MVESTSEGPLTGGSCGRLSRRSGGTGALLPAPRRGPGRTKALWSALFAAVVAAGLWLGADRPSSSTPAARVYAIASQLRCPVCVDESAAQANTPPARAIRADIAARLRKGESEREIIAYMVSRYGRWILLSPPTSGLGLTVWVAPVVVALGALAIVGVAWSRAVRRSGEAWTAVDEEQVPAFAFRSSREPAGPPPSGGLHSRVQAEGKLFEAPVTLQSADVGGTGAAVIPDGKGGRGGRVAKPRRLAAPWKRLSLPLGVALVALAATLLLVDHFSAPELPGETITGSTPGLAPKLEEAEALTDKDPVRALAVYQQILAAYPDEAIALTGEGWIYAEAGFASMALAQLTKAEKADPSYSLAHLYRGLVLLEEDKQRQAAAELKWFLAHDPSSNLAQATRRALAQAKR